MTCDELLYEIYELLSEGSFGQASDLLTEFILNLPQIPSGISVEKYGSLSDGSPHEIVDRLKKVFTANNLLLASANIDCNEDDSFLTKSDLDLIDEIASGLESNTIKYVLGEENSPPKISSSNFPAQTADSVHNSVDRNGVHIDAETHPHEADNSQLPRIELNAEKFDKQDDLDFFEMENELPEEMLLDSGEIETLEEIDIDDETTDSVGYGATLIDDYDYDPFEFDGYQEREILVDVGVGRLTRAQRARQAAVIVAVCYQLGEEGADLLGEIFEKNGWGQARIAIENLIKSGTSLETLSLAMELKDIWVENDSYSLALLKLGNRTGCCTYLGGRILSWQMAAKIVRLFPNGEIEEVERFLDSAFDLWYESDRIKLEFNVFLNYVKHLVSSSTQLNILPDFLMHYGDLSEEFESEAETLGYGGSLYCDLLKYGLIPDVWDRFSSFVVARSNLCRNELPIIEDAEDEECDDDE